MAAKDQPGRLWRLPVINVRQVRHQCAQQTALRPTSGRWPYLTDAAHTDKAPRAMSSFAELAKWLRSRALA